MAEPLTAFVVRRKPDWDALEALLSSQRHGALTLPDVEALDRLYRRAAADLAQAQSFFPATDVHRFLNQLCSQAHGSIYRRPAERLAAARSFFRTDFPRTLRDSLPFLATSAALFLGGALSGALTILWQPSSAEALIPPGIRQFVEGGRMWTDDLFALGPPSVLAAGIATNNLTVTIVTFATGLLAGVGTCYLLLFNGLHLGSVLAYCAKAHLLGQLVAFIGAHGPVELSIIVIAGAAGLRLGNALVAPGDRLRRDALTQDGQRAVRLVVGCAPFLAAIAVVEGFISPGRGFPAPLKLALGLLLAALFWLYLFTSGSSAVDSIPVGSASTDRRSR
jgi:uncharacterized membrane protein SpoIIM required for sporulation